MKCRSFFQQCGLFLSTLILSHHVHVRYTYAANVTHFDHESCYIVIFDDPSCYDDFVLDHNDIILEKLPRLNMILTSISDESEIDVLRQLDGVTLIEKDAPGNIVTGPSDNNERRNLKESPSFERHLSESIGWNIDMVGALNVSDEHVSNKKVCLLGSGYQLGHEDLPTNVTGCDDNDAPDWYIDSDPNSLGTFNAGIIAALGGNAKGVVGIIRNGEINLHVAKYDIANGAYVSGILRSLEYCAEEGSDIIALPFTITEHNTPIESAINTLYNSNAILIGEAYRERFPGYLPNVISVTAIDSDKNHIYGSSADLSAPGATDIVSTTADGMYSTTNRFFASSHVVGVAALVWSHYPTESNDRIRSALLNSAEDLGDEGYDSTFGWGLVRADSAVDYIQGQVPSTTPSAIRSLTPSAYPSSIPTPFPSLSPSLKPSTSPSLTPSSTPSMKPSRTPSSAPSSKPSSTPSSTPSFTPSSTPSMDPSSTPSSDPSSKPSSTPSSNPSLTPSSTPSMKPSSTPSDTPSLTPSSTPSMKPSSTPSDTPSLTPSSTPSMKPSSTPSSDPSSKPSNTPSDTPSLTPSSTPSMDPSSTPSAIPSVTPSTLPSSGPSLKPSTTPSVIPSSKPSLMPSAIPSQEPTTSPSLLPSSTPSTSRYPTQSPSDATSLQPTYIDECDGFGLSSATAYCYFDTQFAFDESDSIDWNITLIDDLDTVQNVSQGVFLLSTNYTLDDHHYNVELLEEDCQTTPTGPTGKMPLIFTRAVNNPSNFTNENKVELQFIYDQSIIQRSSLWTSNSDGGFATFCIKVNNYLAGSEVTSRALIADDVTNPFDMPVHFLETIYIINVDSLTDWESGINIERTAPRDGGTEFINYDEDILAYTCDSIFNPISITYTQGDVVNLCVETVHGSAFEVHSIRDLVVSQRNTTSDPESIISAYAYVTNSLDSKLSESNCINSNTTNAVCQTKMQLLAEWFIPASMETSGNALSIDGTVKLDYLGRRRVVETPVRLRLRKSHSREDDMEQADAGRLLSKDAQSGFSITVELETALSESKGSKLTNTGPWITTAWMLVVAAFFTW